MSVIESANPAILRPAPAAAAIIVVDGDRYLLQLRDDRPNIWFPGHWGCFGGGIEPGESPIAALQRELVEELDFATDCLAYFCRFDFDYGFAGGTGVMPRYFFELAVAARDVALMRLGEGQEMRLFSAAEIQAGLRLTPYDGYAFFLHANRARIGAT
jgi:8-oxo-dGTP pyrophosphatase MutT (NUDIX family)